MKRNGISSVKRMVWDVSHSHLPDSPHRNMSHGEQDASVVAGAALVGMGLAKVAKPTGWAMLALGGGLLYRGLTGQCQLYKALGVNRNR